MGLGWLATNVRAGNEAPLQKEVPVKAASTKAPSAKTASATTDGKITKIVKTDAEWKKILPPETYYVMRQEGTQPAFTPGHDNHGKGIWHCAACDLPLFSSDTKFESGTGWPSFWKPIAGHVTERTDADGERTEVRCARCDGHLGHVFNDGPAPTGLRYCMNLAALKLEAD